MGPLTQRQCQVGAYGSADLQATLLPPPHAPRMSNAPLSGHPSDSDVASEDLYSGNTASFTAHLGVVRGVHVSQGVPEEPLASMP